MMLAIKKNAADFAADIGAGRFLGNNMRNIFTSQIFGNKLYLG